MDAKSLEQGLDEGLWPLVQAFLASGQAAGVAIGVVREDEVVLRGFGVRDMRYGTPVTPKTMFHLASVSKPFVATAVLSLTERGPGSTVVDLDAPITDWVPEFTLADGRAAEVTPRRLLSHSSGLPDVVDYGWHDPQLGDDALSEFARSLCGWRLQAEPGSSFHYSNAGFELLGLLLARVTGMTFEDGVRKQVLAPFGMRDSTFRRAEVSAHLASSPHVGMPLTVPEAAYPYTRRHAPSSTMHSNVLEMCRWMRATLDPTPGAAPDSPRQPSRLSQELLDLMWHPAVRVGHPPWEEAAGLGWAVGTYMGHRIISHGGTDPGFGSKLVLVPGRSAGVVVLANSNTVPTTTIAAAALDVALTGGAHSAAPGVAECEGLTTMRALLPPVVGPVAETLGELGPNAAAATFHRLVAANPAGYDFDDEVFVDAVWGAIELHRTALVWPLLRLWTDLRPNSSAACTMVGWAYLVDGDIGLAAELLRRAVELDPGNEEAARILNSLISA